MAGSKLDLKVTEGGDDVIQYAKQEPGTGSGCSGCAGAGSGCSADIIWKWCSESD